MFPNHKTNNHKGTSIKIKKSSLSRPVLKFVQTIQILLSDESTFYSDQTPNPALPAVSFEHLNDRGKRKRKKTISSPSFLTV
jgi:hypothetical protein